LTDYDFRHLVRHLAIAHRERQLHALLALETSGGANAWFVARDSRSETDGYLQDLRLAREIADSSAERHRAAILAKALGAQCRYALMRAALADVGRHVSPRLAACLVDGGQWTEEQALAYASRSDPNKRFEIVIGALARARGPRRGFLAAEALAAARPLIDDVEQTSKAIVALADNVADPYAADVVNLLRSVRNGWTRAIALEALAPRLAASLATVALELADGIEEPAHRVTAFGALCAAVPEPERTQAFVQAVAAVKAAPEPLPALTELAQRLPSAHIEDLYIVGQQVAGNGPQSDLLELHLTLLGQSAAADPAPAIQAVRELAENDWSNLGRAGCMALERTAVAAARAGMIEDALDVVRLIPDSSRADTIASVAALVPHSTLSALFDEFCRLPKMWRSESALVALARASDIRLGRRVLAAAKQMDKETTGFRINRVATALPEPLRTEATTAAFRELDLLAWWNSSTVAELATALPADIVADALGRIDASPGDPLGPSQGEVVGALAARLAQCGRHRAALDAVLRIADPRQRSEALDSVAAELPLEMLGEVRAAIAPSRQAKEWVTARAAVAAHLPPARLERILGAAADLADPGDRVDALIELAARSNSTSVRERAYELALAAVPEIRFRNQSILLHAFESVLANLPPELTQAAIVVPGRIPDPESRFSAARMVAIRAERSEDVAGTDRARAWSRAIAAARRLPSATGRADALNDLACCIPPGHAGELLHAARRSSESARAAILINLASALPQDLIKSALVDARRMRRHRQLPVLGELTARLDPNVRQDMIDAVYRDLEADHDAYAGGWLYAAALQFAGQDRSPTAAIRLDRAYEWASGLENPADRATSLALLASLAADHRGAPEALEAADLITDEQAPLVVETLGALLPGAFLNRLVMLATGRLRSLEDIARDPGQSRSKDKIDSADQTINNLHRALGAVAEHAAKIGTYDAAVAAVELTARTRPWIVDGTSGRYTSLDAQVMLRVARLLPPAGLARISPLSDHPEIRGECAVLLGQRGRWDDATALIAAIVERYQHVQSSNDDLATPIVRLATFAPRRRLKLLLESALRLSDDDRAQALPAILGRVSEAHRRSTVEASIATGNADLVAALAEFAAKLPRRTLLRIWRQRLHEADQRGEGHTLGSQKHMLSLIRALAPALAGRFDELVALAIDDALETVERWWWA